MREPLLDWLQAFPFWLMDVSSIESLSLPLFTPLSGFASISAPEITVELQDIKEGNWHFKRSAIKGADVSPITLTRGVTFFDSDFWRWITAGITGNTGGLAISVGSLAGTFNIGPSPRRQLVLIQYFARNPFGSVGSVIATAAAVGLGTPPDYAPARVPARAWVLSDCLPTRYKAGSDFDARSGEVSIAELELKPELVEEISLTG